MSIFSLFRPRPRRGAHAEANGRASLLDLDLELEAPGLPSTDLFGADDDLSGGAWGRSAPVGAYYREQDVAVTDVATGAMFGRSGARMCALTEDFWRGLLAALDHEVGASASDLVLRSCGKRWGRLYASRFRGELSRHHGAPLDEMEAGAFQACLDNMFSHHGWGRIELDFGRRDRGLVLVAIRGTLPPDLGDPPAKATGDPLMEGTLAGFFSELAGRELDCAQTRRAARSNEPARFVIATSARLGPVGAWVEEGLDHDRVLEKLMAPAA